MKTKTNRWLQRIDTTTDHFLASFAALSPKQLNWKPSPKEWSIAQILDHLIVLNASYFPIVESVRNGTYRLPLIGKIGFISGLAGKLILKSVLPGSQKKMSTLAIWEPSKSAIPEDIFKRFENHQIELKKFISANEYLAKAGTVICSPANRMIAYRLEAAFEIIVTHEERHYQQAIRVREEYEAWEKA